MGVPDKLVVIDVIAVASAVIVTTSQLSVFIVGVAELVIVVTRFVVLLLVNVSVPANVASVPVVGSVIFVEPVVVKVSALVAVNVTTSPPANVIELVANVVESLTVRVLLLVSVKVPVLAVIVIPFILLLVKASLPAKVARVPVVGSVTFVVLVVVNVKALAAVNVTTSPPANVIELVAIVVESLTDNVFPLVMVIVPVLDVKVSPFMLVAVAAPRDGVVKTGEVEKTKFVDVVPVAPAAVYPVMLLKAVIPAELAFVPPLATGKTPVTSVVNTTSAHAEVPVPVPLNTVPEVGVDAPVPILASYALCAEA